MRRLAAILLALVGLAGCASRMERATALQAAHDFNCLSETIKIQKVAFAEYRATGCDKRASYQLVGECFFDWNPCRAARLSQVEELSSGTAK